ncbi:MAG: DUF721 domain-containing protein [Treponema sp.]|nr:DUF721 domain-containing protein [Treponema sp.]
MNEDIMGINGLIQKAFDQISMERAKSASDLERAWKTVLGRIKAVNYRENPNEGQNMADHSRIVDLKNGVLLVEADHPGWITLLQFHKKFILKGLSMECQGMRINTLAFRLKGNRGDLFAGGDHDYSQEDVKRNIERRIEKEENDLKSFSAESGKERKREEKKEIPPELITIFEDLRKSMLTNSEK